MKTIHQKLSDTEFEIQNLTMFISQCMDKLHTKMIEYTQLQKELYVGDGIQKLNKYANTTDSVDLQ